MLAHLVRETWCAFLIKYSNAVQFIIRTNGGGGGGRSQIVCLAWLVVHHDVVWSHCESVNIYICMCCRYLALLYAIRMCVYLGVWSFRNGVHVRPPVRPACNRAIIVRCSRERRSCLHDRSFRCACDLKCNSFASQLKQFTSAFTRRARGLLHTRLETNDIGATPIPRNSIAEKFVRYVIEHITTAQSFTANQSSSILIGHRCIVGMFVAETSNIDGV